MLAHFSGFGCQNMFGANQCWSTFPALGYMFNNKRRPFAGSCGPRPGPGADPRPLAPGPAPRPGPRAPDHPVVCVAAVARHLPSTWPALPCHLPLQRPTLNLETSSRPHAWSFCTQTSNPSPLKRPGRLSARNCAAGESLRGSPCRPYVRTHIHHRSASGPDCLASASRTRTRATRSKTCLDLHRKQHTLILGQILLPARGPGLGPRAPGPGPAPRGPGPARQAAGPGASRPGPGPGGPAARRPGGSELGPVG